MTGIEALIDDFIARVRRGDRPDPEEYAAGHPELAAEVRDLFPALAALEAAAATGDDPAAPAPPPRQLGEYLILREAGRGGMGVVYEAVQESLGRHVALKVLTPGSHARPAHVERFRREARAAAGLHHTNIVPVFGVGEQAGTHFYAMQFIRGQTLSAVVAELRSRPAGPAAVPAAGPAGDSGASALVPGFYRNVARLAAQAADGLAHAHRHGFVHRDVKPSNLLLDTAGTVWVSDFGLAKGADGGTLTETGDVLGTLAYMAPEQLDGWADARTDVYALGLTLYELATLTPAFRDDVRGRLIEAVRRGTPPAPRARDPRLPRDLETVIRKATAPDPAHRYQTAGEFADDLRRFADGRTILARRATRAARAWRWARRNPAVAGLAATVFGFLVAATIGSAVAVVGYERQRDRAVGAEREAEERAWRARLSEARAIAQSGHPGQRFRALRLLREAITAARRIGLTPDDEREFRSVAAGALMLPDFAGATGPEPAIEAHSTETGGVTVVRSSDGTVLGRVAGAGRPSRVAVSPDGRRVAVVHAGPAAGLVVYDVRADGLAERVRLPGALLAAPTFSPDGRRIVGQTTPDALWVRDLDAGGEWAIPVENGPAEPVPVAFSAVGDLAYPAFAKGRYGLRLWRDGRSTAVPGPLGDGRVSGIEWDPTGRWLAVADDSRVVRVWDAREGWEVGPGLSHPARGLRARFTARSDRLMTLDATNQFRVWEVPTGRLLVNVPNPGPADFPHLADADPAAEAGYAAGGELVRAVRLSLGEDWAVGPEGVAFSPTDGIVAAGFLPERNVISSDGVVLLDRTTGMPVAFIHGLPMHPVGFLADGSLLTSGYYGVLHWPRAEGGGEVTFGPPDRWHPRGEAEKDAVAAPTGHAAFPRGGELRLIVPGRPDARWPTGFSSREEAAFCPDGRWGAIVRRTRTPGPNLRVFDPAVPGLVHEADLGPPTGVGFSPDGRWVWASDGRARVWRTGTWEPGPTVGGRRLAITHDGRIAAGDAESGGVRLVRLDGPDAGAEILTLPTADREPVIPVAFSPDGSRLAAHAADSRLLLVWDLDRLRRGLAALGLDWEPTAPPLVEPPRRRYRIDPGRYRATDEAFRHLTRDDYTAAAAIYRSVVRDDPADLLSRVRLSELYLFGPPAVRDPAAADGPTADLLRAADADARDGPQGRTTYLAMRGAYEYHRGRFAEARALLDRVERADVGESVLYPLVRGLTLRALGRADEAREYLDKTADQLDWHPVGHTWHRRLLKAYRDEQMNRPRP